MADQQRTSEQSSPSRRLTWTLALAPVLAAGVSAAGLLAGCGGASNGAAGNAAPPLQRQATVVLRDLARCLRAHGLPGFPDPEVGSDGVARFPDSAPRVPLAAQQACQAVAARIPPGYTTTTPVSSGDFQKLLQLARCIRAHGIPDWPDPNPLGEFPINARIESGGKRLFVPAVHACARLNPNPGGGIHAVRAQPAR
jgi:hypothetical protein